MNISNNKIIGLGFKLNYKGTSIAIRLNKILAKHNIYAALVGVAIGVEMGLNLVEIAEALKDFSLPPGRMRPLMGIKNTFIISFQYFLSLAIAAHIFLNLFCCVCCFDVLSLVEVV